MEKIKIGCLTYRKLDTLTRDAIKKIVDPMLEIRVIEGLMEELIQEVEKLKKEGFFVYIGGGANYGTIRNTTEVHVVEIKLTAFDYIDAIHKAKQHGKRIAVVSFKSSGENYFPQLSQIMGAEIIPVCFQDPEELELKLKAAQVEAVIGASLANEKAAKLGLPGILVYPGEETIIDTIKEAKEVAITLKREKERSKIVQTIIDFAPNGVIATDQKDDIILFNPSAEKIFGINSAEALGEPITKMIPNIRFEDNFLQRKTQL
ncbi:MAG: PrpR N-terminal domain-containing protein, partial [Bacillota bacterium]|nr:PrpR N-terminal domain-containing protein [Bacillota bacterium]